MKDAMGAYQEDKRAVVTKQETDGFSLILFGTKVADSKEF